MKCFNPIIFVIVIGFKLTLNIVTQCQIKQLNRNWNHLDVTILKSVCLYSACCGVVESADWKKRKIASNKIKTKDTKVQGARQKCKFKTKNREQRFFRRKSKTWKNRQIKVIWTVKSERSTSVEFPGIQTIICLHSKWKWKVWGGGKRGQEKLTQRLHEIFEQNTFKDQVYRFIIFRKIILLMFFYS